MSSKRKEPDVDEDTGDKEEEDDVNTKKKKASSSGRGRGKTKKPKVNDEKVEETTEKKTEEEPAKMESETEEKGKEKVSDSVTVAGTSSGSWPSDGPLVHLTDNSWREILTDEIKKPYFKSIIKFVEEQRKIPVEVYPPPEDVFSAFNYTPFATIKVVIIGQDPYFNAGQAHGLSFSVRKGIKVPPSLNAMYNALTNSIPDFKKPKHGYLEKWAKEGVLMLNATLTVEKGKPNSHAKCGWQEFTDAVIKFLNENKKGLVFMLWGGFAQKKGAVISRENHCVLEGPHPSPQAGGSFKFTKHFVDANKYLSDKGKTPIDWKIE